MSLLLSTSKLEYTPVRPANFVEQLVREVAHRAEVLEVPLLVKALHCLSDGPHLSLSTSLLVQKFEVDSDSGVQEPAQSEVTGVTPP